MKTALCLSLASFITLQTVAQAPVLVAPTSQPAAGMVVTVFAGNLTSPGPSGANQHWHFTSMGQVPRPSINWLGCSASTVNCGNYPGANLASVQGTAQEYYEKNNGSLALVGTNSQGVSAVYTNSMKVMEYPFTYLSAFTDSFRANFSSGGNPVFRKGAISVTADGYGVLMTNADVFNNALRVHRTEDYRDSAVIGGSPVLTHYVIESYIWYTPLLGDFILKWSQTTINGTALPEAVTYTSQQPNNVGDISGSISTLQVYPNPAKDKLVISFAMAEKAKISTVVTDITGRQVLSVPVKEYQQGQQHLELDLQSLSAGVYILHLKDEDGGTISRKIEKY